MDNEAVARAWWNRWNTESREQIRGPVSLRQAEVIVGWLRGRKGLKILDAGCGTGWMAEQLLEHGDVVGIDLADEVIARAQARVPQARFEAGDLMTIDVGHDFDVVVSLEVLSHVPDRPAFLRHLASVLRPGGQLFMATQNRPVLARFNDIPPPGPGQLRYWVDRAELRRLLADAGFVVDKMFVVSPMSDKTLMRFVVRAGRKFHMTRPLELLGLGWTIMVSATKR